MCTLYVSSNVRHAKIDGLYVVLSLDSEEYYILAGEASLVWACLVEADGDLDRARVEYTSGCAEDRNQARELFDDFVADFSDLGFLAEARPSPPCASPRQPGTPVSALQAWWSLVWTLYALKTHGFRKTYLAYARNYGASAPPRTVPRSEGSTYKLAQATRAFLRAENFVWLRRAPDDCLPRSLALFRFLRSAGLPAFHYIGGRRAPAFTMHAWVECDGAVLLDSAEEVEKVNVLATLPERTNAMHVAEAG